MFKDQVSLDVFVQDIFFVLSTMAVVPAVAGLGLIDSGLSRRKNVLDQWIQKLVAGFCVALGFLVVGYAVWQWQFNQAFGTPHALRTAISGWWLGGANLSHFAQTFDPKVMPEADVLQIFAGFFVTFAFILGAFMHSAGMERVKPLPLYLMCFVVGATTWPLLSYLVWGSLSPLTNRGLHDYTGIFNLYLFVGGWSVVMAWRLRPRLGTFTAHPREVGPRPHNMSHVALGVFLLMFAIPFIVLGSGYIVPGSGYFGISMTTSGFGVAFLNVLCAFIGGGLGGALLSYRQRNPTWALLGPISGYVSCAALFDIGKPWETLLVAFFGPGFVYLAYRLLHRLRVDDPKIGPLTLGAGVYGAIIAGVIGWGTPTGGYFGLTGRYGFQHARINPGWQVIGVVVAVGFGALSALVLTTLCQKTIGLRVSEDVEVAGLDSTYWSIPQDDQPSGAVTPVGSPGHPGGPRNGDAAPVG